MTYHGGTLGKKRGKPVLIDVDGITANFCGGLCDYFKDRFDIDVDQSKIFGDVRDEAKGLWDDECEDFVKSEGFARTLKPYPGSVEAIRDIIEEYDVVFVTSPYGGSHTWCWDRFMWLRDHFQISRDDIIFARDKRFVSGITLIDDRYENVIDWSYFHKKPAILMERPWNLKDREGDLVEVDFRTSTPYDTQGCVNKAKYLSLDTWSKIHSYLRLLG